MSKKRTHPKPLKYLFKLLIGFPIWFAIYHTIIRILRYFVKFPIPEFMANLIDNPIRRKIQPPDLTAIRNGIRVGMTVLEIGPGNGTYTMAAARRVGDTGKLITIDIEPKMIERVTRRAYREGLKNIEARVGDFYDLPFGDGTFDLVYMIAVIGEIPDPVKAMQEFYRVLKPTGNLVFSELFFDPDYPLVETLKDQAAAAKFQQKRLSGNFFAYTLTFDKNYTPPDTSAISDVVRSKEDAKISYNRMSKWYDQVAGSSERVYVEFGLHKLDAQKGEKVLEIGFVTGNGILSLAGSVGERGKVCGIDISDNMLSITQERVNKTGYEQNVVLKCGDAVHLPFRNGDFDAVFISFALELFDTPEIPLVLKECRRVLKRDGRIGIVAMAKKRRDNLPVRLYEWAHNKMPKLADCRPIYASRSIEESGFQILSCDEKSMWGLPIEIVIAVK